MSDSGVCTEIMLFGVRVKVDPIRKCVSMNDLSQYVHVHLSNSNSNSNNNSNNLDGPVAVSADSGYASADDAIRNQSNCGRERKRGVPWTEEEHKRFLLGLQKVGKGDWRGISRKYVKTRTPTQVASHAQKYFLRRTNLNRRRRRSSLFDITTADSVADIPMEEQQVHEDNNSQPSRQPIENQMETVTFNNSDQFNGGPTRGLATKGDNYLGKKYERDSLSLSLSLNLSRSCDRNNGNGLISVG